jgi:hypothetical protein
MTTTITLIDGQTAIFAAIDHCTAECVGIHAAAHGTRFEALESSVDTQNRPLIDTAKPAIN